MAGDAASVTIGVLLQNLIDISKDEISLIRGLEEDADNLKATLATFQCFLDDAQEKVIDAAVKTWLNELEAVAFDADNVLDELNYQRLSEKKKSIHTKKKKVPSCLPSFNHCVTRRDMAVKIRKLNTNFKSINEKATKLGLEKRLADAPAAAPEAAPETDSFTVDPIFIGRDNQVKEIVAMLTTPTEEAVSIVPIVGMGGLGKTTLSRNVFNNQKIKTHFAQRIWVHVSENFGPVILLKKILTNLTKGSVGDESREVLLSKLQQALGEKTYLLVLDDVWNQDRHQWGDFINSWLGITSVKGNGIIVTTRNTEVGLIVKKTLDIQHLEGLTHGECWTIIKDRASEGGSITPDLEDIGRSIAERCQGLPLAAHVVGAVLHGQPRSEWLSIKDKWLSIKDKWLSDDVGGDENNISKILKLSFHHLSSPTLKKCFAYCSTFPKGYRIEREILIELWMAEGFLQLSQTSDHMENIGDKFFKFLLQSTLLQVMHRDFHGTVISCSMHDLVHDLASSVLGSLVNDDGTYRARYICSKDKSIRIPKEQAKWLRTLIYNGRISDIVFIDFKSLHALTLTSNHERELPDSIKELIHLRSLNISRTRIKNLPESIGKLYHLQTLRTCLVLQKLPSTLIDLFNLRHLHMKLGRYIDLPPHMGKLTFLQTLTYFKVCKEEGCQIEELGSLKNLKGKLKIFDLDQVGGEEESRKAYLFQKLGIVELEFVWDGNREGVIISDEDVLKGLQPHPNLKILKIDGFGGANFPAWTLKMSVCLEGHWVQLQNLVEVTLLKCGNCEEIPTLGTLPLLKYLSLCGLYKVKSIDSSFYGACKETVSVFPALESLEVEHLWDLREWRGVEIPSAAEVKVFPRLNNLKIKCCRELASMCGTELTSLTQLSLVGLDQLACLPDWLFRNNQSLSSLDIIDCPMLKELPNDLPTLNSLEEMTIKFCPNLKSIQRSNGPESQGFKSLRTLSMRHCQELMDFPWEMMLSLEELVLGEGIMMMPKIMECLPNMSCLTKLEIHIFPQTNVILPLRLQSLTICSGDSVSSCSLNEVVNGMLLRLGSHSLSRLHLKVKGDWESLPDQIQHLSILRELTLSGLGSEELPEWLGNLSSLKILDIWDCERLKCLPSVEAMRRLTNLKTLNIASCPLLKGIENQSDDVDSEWPKISQIPTIQLNWKYIQTGGRIRQ